MTSNNSAPPLIVLVEDSPADTYIVRQSLQKHLPAFELRVMDDGEKAFQFVEATDTDSGLPCPHLMILDLNLPKRSGHEILQRLRNSSRCKRMPVMIVTSSDSPADRAETARLGATAYFCKPCNLEEFMALGTKVREILGKGK